MFSHLQELLSFETVPASPSEATRESKSEPQTSPTNDSIYLAPSVDNEMVEEEPMEEIALEVTRSGGVVAPPPPGALVEDTDSVSGSSAGAVVEGSKKRGILASFSKSKSRDSGGDATGHDVESDDDYNGKVVGIAAEPTAPEKAPSARNTYRYKKETNKKGWLICIAVLIVIAAVAVPCAILIPRNNERSTGASSATDSDNSDTGDNNSGTTAAPTAAPTAATDAGELPQECEPAYDNLDNCLLTEVTAEEADECINCVWGFLPDNNGPCAQLEQEVCNILSQCECLTCTDELQNYLDCQSDCELDCIF